MSSPASPRTVSWYEQVKQNGEITFKEHVVLEKGKKPNQYGVTFSQLHALDLIDMDGDGVKDIVTGKRFWAHGAHGDVDPSDPAVIYWFQIVRNKDSLILELPCLVYWKLDHAEPRCEGRRRGIPIKIWPRLLRFAR